MRLSEIIGEKHIKVGLEAEDTTEAIEELLDILISEHEVSLRNRDTILDIIFKRENSVSTGVGGGVAIPHGTVDCVDDIVGAIGISKDGIDFKSFDGDLVHIVLLLLVPKSKFGKHIKTLAHVARLFIDESVRNKIRCAKSAQDVLAIIDKAERLIEQ